MNGAIELRPKNPNPDVVKFLEEALERAMAGDINGVIILEQSSTELTYKAAGTKNRFETIGHLFHAIHKLQSD